jgi:hypothetical protein
VGERRRGQGCVCIVSSRLSYGRPGCGRFKPQPLRQQISCLRSVFAVSVFDALPIACMCCVCVGAGGGGSRLCASRVSSRQSYRRSGCGPDKPHLCGKHVGLHVPQDVTANVVASGNRSTCGMRHHIAASYGCGAKVRHSTLCCCYCCCCLVA